MAVINGVERISSTRNSIITIITNRDENAFNNSCQTCEDVFGEIDKLNLNVLTKTEKRELVGILTSLKDIVLQLINIKMSVFAESKGFTDSNLSESIEAKRFVLEKNDKRAA